MRRRLITRTENVFNYIPIDIPDELKGYGDELRFLKEIPLPYLLSDESDLSEESIRFFVLDINWTDALLDGAFSLGRVCKRERTSDIYMLKSASADRTYLDTPRMKRMHPNHKRTVEKMTANAPDEPYTLVSGFLMRSQLVRRMKGMHLYGYDEKGAPKSDRDDGTPLNILRMETIADDILIALFSGEVYEIMIEEPKTGLSFGVSSVNQSGGRISRSIDLRSALDDDDLGKRISSLCVDQCIQDNGKLHAKKLADLIEVQLKGCGKLGSDRLSPSRFAFELIAVAHRAKFTASKKEGQDGR